MIEKPKFYTDFVYNNREKRVQYLWLKYQSILTGKRILDVGADDCHLKKWLDSAAQYWGIGLGGNVDQQFNLESGPLPFLDQSYDVVLCMDVLEHLEGIHRVFDELCRVSKQYVIISLPNCLGYLWRVLTQYGGETENSLMKYYGLPIEPPMDRHRWFFDAFEAERFIRLRARENQMNVIQIDSTPLPFKPNLKKRLLLRFARWALLHRRIDQKRLFLGPTWAVLGRKQGV